MTTENHSIPNKKSSEEERPKVFVRSLGKVAFVRRIEQDSVWGPQYLVSTYTREWGPEYFWVMSKDVEELVTYKTPKQRT